MSTGLRRQIANSARRSSALLSATGAIQLAWRDGSGVTGFVRERQPWRAPYAPGGLLLRRASSRAGGGCAAGWVWANGDVRQRRGCRSRSRASNSVQIRHVVRVDAAHGS